MRRSLLSFALLIVLAGAARAAPNDLSYAPPPAPAPPDAAGLVLRLVGLTVGLLAVCGGVLWFAKRATRHAGPKGDGAGRLKLDASLVLNRACAVHLVTVDGQTVAVTTDASGLRSIVLLSEPFEAALAAAGAEPPVAPEPPTV